MFDQSQSSSGERAIRIRIAAHIAKHGAPAEAKRARRRLIEYMAKVTK